MKVLIVSDNHGHPELLTDLAAKYQHYVDHMIHCGDSEMASSNPLWEIMTTVRGNTDFGPFKAVEVIATAKGKIAVTHGHLFGLHFGLEELVNLAKDKQAKVVCYGHTHVMANTVKDGIRLINPGSIRKPRGRYPFPSYAILDWQDNDEMQVTFYNNKHEEISSSEIY